MLGFSSGESQPVAPQATQASSGFSFFRSESNESSYVATEGELTSSRMTGFGNSSMNNPPAASTPSTFSSTGMTGIGNPNFKDPRNEVSWTKKISALAEGALGSSTQPATSDYQMRSNRESPFGETHKTPAYLPSNPGPWNPSASHGTSSPLNTPSGGIVPDIPSIAGGLGRAGHAASDGAYEQSLIASLCEAGGMKAAPPDDKLEEFLTAAPTLSPEFIGSSLVGFINSDAWQSRAKALVVVGALAKRSGCAQHMGWWIANGAEDIQILAQTDSKATVKTQAIKTLRALGISSNSASIPVTASQSRTTSAVSVTTTSSGNSVSLLDFENELSTPNVPTVPESHPRPVSDASTTPADGAPSDLFDGLALGSPAPLVSQPVAPPVQPPQSTNSLFDFMETPPSNPPQNQQHTTLDLNSLYGPPVVTPPPPPPTMAPLAGLNLSVPVRMPQQYPPHMQHQGYPSAGFPPPQVFPL